MRLIARPELDRASPVPLFLQIRQSLIADIRSWQDPDARFPSDVELSERFGVSKMTVRQALDDLVVSGLLVRQRGKGTFVTERAYVERLSQSLDIDQQYLSSGAAPTTRLLMYDLLPATAMDRSTFLDPDLASVLVIKRVRAANGIPIALDERTIPLDVARSTDFNESAATGSIVGRLRLRLRLSKAQWNMCAMSADEDLALVLCIRPNDPVLERAMTYFDQTGQPVLHGRTWHRGDLVSCAFELPLDDGKPNDLFELDRDQSA